jgi:hypothetical protein
LFPNLPLELRLKIWSYAGDHPRTLQLTATWDNELGGGIEGNNQVPGILQACSESRQEGLKHYEACTKRCSWSEEIHDTNGHVESRKPCPASKVYINFDFDRFYLKKIEVVEQCRQPVYDSVVAYQLERKDLAKVQILDIPWEFRTTNTLHESVTIIGEAKSLREMNFIVTPYFCEKVQLDNPQSVEAICPNTITSEICMMEHRNKIKKALDEEMIDNYYWQDPTAWESLNHAKVDCKWTAIPEEMDLFPIPAGAAAAYDSGSGCAASVAAVRTRR